MNRDFFEAEVISLTSIGPVGKKIQSLGIKVRALNVMRYGLPNPLVILKLAGWLRQSRPVAIQTWMYHADLISSIAARLAHNIPVAWGIHHTDLDPKNSRRSTIWIAKICAKLSNYLPNRIICCSEASRKVHSALGYNKDKMIVIPNGFNLTTFTPDPAARISVRHELEIDKNTILIGLSARFNPQKDHRNFIQAADKLHEIGRASCRERV